MNAFARTRFRASLFYPMNPTTAGPDLARVQEFQRKHRLGLLTLVFTDIVGSTQLKQQHGDARAVELIQQHHAAVREVLVQFGQAEEIETAGDSFLLVFARPSDAVRFSLLIQAQLRALTQESCKPVFDRIGIHVGEVFIQQQEHSTKLFGSQVDLCARVMSLGTANQILMTRFVFDTARQVLRGQDLPGVGPLGWLNHGLYQFKGIEEPTEVCEVQVGTDGPATPPPDTDKAHRYALTEGEPVLGWRPALEQLVPGTKWVIEKKLGEGGFGEVWLGRHDTLKEERVFKFCFRADRVRALKREVTLFRLMKEKIGQHPNIVGIQEVFFDEPPFYIVMDYAQAQDVRAWCEAQGGVDKVPLSTRLEIVAQTADALQAAHKAGVIHRDVKPSNILISNSRSDLPSDHPDVKLTDFGIGQVVSQETLAGMTRMGFTQTMVGPGSSSHTGTQMYMAPELIAGHAASVQSDIYSLGVVLYQLLIGDFAKPLTTDWAKGIDDRLLREDLEKCFAGNPQERFATAAQLAQSIRMLGPRRIALASQERATRRGKIASKAALTAAVVAGLFLATLYAIRSRGTASNALEDILGGTKNKGAQYWYKLATDKLGSNRDQQGLERAADYFHAATTNDTNFALAYVGLARVCWFLQNLYDPTNKWGTVGFQAAERAIQLCPTLPDAYVARGALAFSPFKKFDARSDVTNQLYALELNQRVKGAHFNLAFVYQHFGFFDEAAKEAQKELDIYPEDLGPLWFHSQTLTMQGEYQKGLRVAVSMPEEAFPHPRMAAWVKALALFYCGSNSQATAEINRVLRSGEATDDGLLASLQAVLCAAAGDKSCAELNIQKAKSADAEFIDFHHIAYQIGLAYALMGRADEALPWLERAANEGYSCYTLLARDPNLAPIRTNVLFTRFLEAQRQQDQRNRAELLGPKR
jgi:serine/threonine protein kinase/class 3 adenylate cyclase